MPERIPIGADHAGYDLKEVLVAELERRGFDVEDVGTHSTESTGLCRLRPSGGPRGRDRRGEARHPDVRDRPRDELRGEPPSHGVRAAVAWTPEIAALARRYNDANVLVLPARFVDADTARAILGAWLDTPFEGGRHERRIAKIEDAT